MTRRSQSGKKTSRVSEVLSDHGTSLGGLLKHASLLMQIEHLVTAFLDPGLSAHFQVAAIHGKRLVIVTPGAVWASRLKMQVPQLLDSLHQAGYTQITFIDVRVAPLVEQATDSRKRKRLSPAAQQALDLMNHLVADDED